MSGTSPLLSRAVPPEERVFSLILALVASPNGLTKHELLSSVHGYSADYIPGGNNASLERKFERDKEQLRALGVPLEVIDSPTEPGNNQLQRYRVAKSELQLPRNVAFSRDELTLLSVAAEIWREGSLSDETRRALIKLNSLGAEIDVRHLGVAPKLHIEEPHADILKRAIESAQCVEFLYRRPDQLEPSERTVAPLRLHRADGRWHLIAFDLEKDDFRVFLLRRMTGKPKQFRCDFPKDAVTGVERVIRDLEARQQNQLAVVHVRNGSVAAARLEPRATLLGSDEDGWKKLQLQSLDFDALAEELVGFGADLRVESPDSLFESVRELFTFIAEQHGGARP